MSKKCKNTQFDPRGQQGSQITTLTYDFPDGYVIPEHFHDQDQLVYACRGVMTVVAAEGTWVVPAQRAVWIPARTPHGIRMSGIVFMRTLYLKPSLLRSLPRNCSVVNVSPLLKELILHACEFTDLSKRVRIQAHLIHVIVDLIEGVEAVPLQLPNPRDPRALRVAKALLADPGDQRPLEEICKTVGGSKRTIERLFQVETHMTFGKWRQQLRLMQGLRLLAGGEKVTNAALESGYNSPSAFISMFRSALGTTPSRYFDDAIAAPKAANAGSSPRGKI